MKLHHNKVISCLSLLLIIFIVTTACTLQPPRVKSSGLPQREYTYQIPEKIDDGWEPSTLETEGVDSKKIIELMGNILREDIKNIHSVLLVKNGKLILEEYFYGYNRDDLHYLASATKSITSILVNPWMKICSRMWIKAYINYSPIIRELIGLTKNMKLPSDTYLA